MIFEPSQEEEKSKKVVRKPKKVVKSFPLGDTIISILKNAVKPMMVGDFITKVPRKFSLSVWGMTLSRLVKNGKVKVVPLENGKKSYKSA